MKESERDEREGEVCERDTHMRAGAIRNTGRKGNSVGLARTPDCVPESPIVCV